MGSGQVVMVSRAKIRACMTCPLCNNLLKEATTISICLHTFCRKCIYERLSDEDVDTCPVCDISLGCIPVDKLRPDHNLQDIRAKVFPFKRRKVEAPEISSTVVSPPTKRKERSLSSLVVNAPRVSSQGGVTGKRTRAGVRRGSGTRSETPTKEDDSVEDNMDDSSSPETLNKIIQYKKQGSSTRSASDQTRGEQMENTEGRDGKTELWKPLNTLVEAANRSKFPNKSGSQVVANGKMNPTSSDGTDACTITVKIEENGHRGDVQGEDSKNMPSVALEPVKRRRGRQANKKKQPGSSESYSSNLVLNVARRNWKDGPIWFSLVASGDHQEGVEPLPQVSAAFLRVKDTTMSVSSIQKYLAKKLNLAHEDEVQVMCHGQPVMPQLKLTSLMDLWLRTSANPKKVRTFVGQPAKDFVMVLSYARKPAVPALP